MVWIKHMFAAGYGLICYLIGVLGLILVIAFANGHIADLGIDALTSLAINEYNSKPADHPVFVNFGLISIFALQHSVMARPRFKRLIAPIIPPRIERSTYVLFSGIALIALVQFWQPMPAIIWQLENPIARTIVNGIYYTGWLISLLATHMINHNHLMGLEQAFVKQPDTPAKKFVTPMLYKFVRHPIQTGIMIALFAAPDMNEGRMIFATGLAFYILIGLFFEERDLIKEFGDTYRDYKTRVPALFPIKFRLKSGPKFGNNE